MQITTTKDTCTVADKTSAFSNAKDPVYVKTIMAKSIAEEQ
jgi:hypothetical protein